MDRLEERRLEVDAETQDDTGRLRREDLTEDEDVQGRTRVSQHEVPCSPLQAVSPTASAMKWTGCKTHTDKKSWRIISSLSTSQSSQYLGRVENRPCRRGTVTALATSL